MPAHRRGAWQPIQSCRHAQDEGLVTTILVEYPPYVCPPNACPRCYKMKVERTGILSNPAWQFGQMRTNPPCTPRTQVTGLEPGNAGADAGDAATISWPAAGINRLCHSFRAGARPSDRPRSIKISISISSGQAHGRVIPNGAGPNLPVCAA